MRRRIGILILFLAVYVMGYCVGHGKLNSWLGAGLTGVVSAFVYDKLGRA